MVTTEIRSFRVNGNTASIRVRLNVPREDPSRVAVVDDEQCEGCGKPLTESTLSVYRGGPGLGLYVRCDCGTSYGPAKLEGKE
jgi:hypothetical protein